MMPMPSRSKVAAARLLVIDDEALIRDTLAEFLTQEGFIVESCASGEQALARASEQQFDIAICDVQLPGIDGLELLDRLLKLSPQTFVLLVTAYATVENAVQAFQRGAHDYLMKPIILDEVLGKLRRMIRFRELFKRIKTSAANSIGITTPTTSSAAAPRCSMFSTSCARWRRRVRPCCSPARAARARN